MGQENHTTVRRKWEQLTERDRYKIEALSGQGMRASEIGEAMEPKRGRRTIERELKRGEVEQRRMNPSNNKYEALYIVEKVYLADVGQRKHEEAASNKGRGLKIGHDHKLAEYIEEKIGKDRWSPDAVIGHIKAERIAFETSICTKTLYNYIEREIFAGISNKDLWVKKEGKKQSYKRVRTVALNNRRGKSIEERPKEANEREESGHWEIDLVVGRQGTRSAILTLVERKTRRSVYVLVKNKTQKEVLAAIRRVRRRVCGDFSEVFRSITADNGSEFLDSEGIKAASRCGEVYYAHPYSSWERGSNENGNKILRRFIPKGMDIGKLTARELQRIEDWVNNYPRKILRYKTANDMVA
jgi:IS30 family transposase